MRFLDGNLRKPQLIARRTCPPAAGRRRSRVRFVDIHQRLRIRHQDHGLAIRGSLLFRALPAEDSKSPPEALERSHRSPALHASDAETPDTPWRAIHRRPCHRARTNDSDHRRGRIWEACADRFARRTERAGLCRWRRALAHFQPSPHAMPGPQSHPTFHVNTCCASENGATLIPPLTQGTATTARTRSQLQPFTRANFRGRQPRTVRTRRRSEQQVRLPKIQDRPTSVNSSAASFSRCPPRIRHPQRKVIHRAIKGTPATVTASTQSCTSSASLPAKQLSPCAKNLLAERHEFNAITTRTARRFALHLEQRSRRASNQLPSAGLLIG